MPPLHPPSSILTRQFVLLCSTRYGDKCRDVSVLKDYEEDFEETDESTKDSGDEREPQQTDEDEEMDEPKMQRRKEIEAIQKAMDEENQRVGTTQTVLDRNREDEDRRKLSRGSFVSDFPETKQSMLLYLKCHQFCLS